MSAFLSFLFFSFSRSINWRNDGNKMEGGVRKSGAEDVGRVRERREKKRKRQGYRICSLRNLPPLGSL
jgi:hypothetical protein